MTREAAVLVVDAAAADRELILLLLQRQLPAATITAVGDALAFAEAIYTRTPDVVVLSDTLPWAGVRDLVALVRQRHPAAGAIVVSGRIDGSAPPVEGGVLCDAWLPKTTAGLLGLPQLTSDVLARGGAAASNDDVRTAPSVPAAAESDPDVTPVPAVDAPEDVAPVATTVTIRPSTEAPRQAASDPASLQDVALLFSHDLREPLQQIARLVRAKAGTEDPTTATLLRRVLHCSERANAMLDSAVEYLSLDRPAREPELVDLNRCLQEALDNLRISIEESHAHVRAGELPAVVGDREQLVHVFQNLISNAIKFRGPEIPIITIGCETRGDEHTLVFRDNGIGVPAEQARRIFGGRARLHTRDQIPGTGLGLALCQAIVLRHGGQVALEAGDTLGSTFTVTLPRALSKPPDDAAPPHAARFERARIE